MQLGWEFKLPKAFFVQRCWDLTIIRLISRSPHRRKGPSVWEANCRFLDAMLQENPIGNVKNNRNGSQIVKFTPPIKTITQLIIVRFFFMRIGYRLLGGYNNLVLLLFQPPFIKMKYY